VGETITDACYHLQISGTETALNHRHSVNDAQLGRELRYGTPEE
jgi:hypothetical protein